MINPDKRAVLLLEDEPIVSMLVEDMLAELGFENIRSASEPGQAIRAVEGEDLAFAIIDVNIAGARSFAVADALMARHVPFIFATGYGPAALEGPYARIPTLQKPFLLDDLRIAIERLDSAPRLV